MVQTSSEPPDSTACPMERFSSCSQARHQMLGLLQAPNHTMLHMDFLHAFSLLMLTCPTMVRVAGITVPQSSSLASQVNFRRLHKHLLLHLVCLEVYSQYWRSVHCHADGMTQNPTS